VRNRAWRAILPFSLIIVGGWPRRWGIELASQFRRHHQKAQAQRRADGLAETSDVQHPPPMIERCKSRCRSSFKAGARAAVAYLSAQNLFKGQSKGFFKVVTALAKAADGVD
jgi:hypothetical protein